MKGCSEQHCGSRQCCLVCPVSWEHTELLSDAAGLWAAKAQVQPQEPGLRPPSVGSMEGEAVGNPGAGETGARVWQRGEEQ